MGEWGFRQELVYGHVDGVAVTTRNGIVTTNGVIIIPNNNYPKMEMIGRDFGGVAIVL